MEARPANRDTAVEFGAFHDEWLIRQEQLLQELLRSMETDSAGREGEAPEGIRADLIGRVLVQFREYYEAKSRVNESNVFLLFAPVWLSPLERTFLWITGFKPSVVFRIVNNSVTDKEEDQARSLEELEREVRVEEDELAAAMALVQRSSVVAPHLATRLPGRSVVNGEVMKEDAVVESLSRCLEGLVERADGLRGKAVVRVVQILSSAQGIKFLAAMMRFQLRLTAWGRRVGAAGGRPGT